MVLGMICFRPRTLSAIALDIVMDLSLLTVIEITIRKTAEREEMTLVYSGVCAVQNYVIDLPSTLISEYTKQLLKLRLLQILLEYSGKYDI